MPNGVLAVQLSPSELTPLEVRQIRTTLDLSYDKVDAAKVLAMSATGAAQLWRIYGVATGIVVTQVIDKGTFKELFVWIMAGENLLPNLKQLLTLLDQLAIDCNCRYVHALAKPRLAAVYVNRHGFRTDAVSVYREVPNGRE